MAQFATNGPFVREVAGVYAGTCRADLPAIPGGVGFFYGVSSDGRVVRGVLVPGFRYGCPDNGGTARLERGTLVVYSLWVGAPLPRARWAGEHIAYRLGVRNGSNRVRWDDSGYVLAFCGRRGSRSGRSEVSIEATTAGRERGNSQFGGNLVTLMTTSSPALLPAETIRRALGEFNLEVSEQQIVCIQQYMKILLAWNEKINLTAIRDPLEILYRHFCESMYAAVAVPVENGRLADVGSGAGFPGIPLKIMRPELQVFLIESNLKKATFLAEVLRNIELPDTRVLVSRYEELGEEVAPLDFVCSRAVGEFEPFLVWAASERIAAKQVILWIGGRDLDQARKGAEWEWREPISVPHSLRRYLLVGTRKSGTVGATT